jgi:hypothetical protein
VQRRKRKTDETSTHGENGDGAKPEEKKREGSEEDKGKTLTAEERFFRREKREQGRGCEPAALVRCISLSLDKWYTVVLLFEKTDPLQ